MINSAQVLKITKWSQITSPGKVLTSIKPSRQFLPFPTAPACTAGPGCCSDCTKCQTIARPEHKMKLSPQHYVFSVIKYPRMELGPPLYFG